MMAAYRKFAQWYDSFMSDIPYGEWAEYIIDRLKEDKITWKNYQHFSDAYKRIRIAYIEAARKRPEEFEKRLNNFINKTKENKIITGFGGIGKYY